MILADTSIWIDYLRGRNLEMPNFLKMGMIVSHPCVIAEIALGSLDDRRKRLRDMEDLFQLKMADLHEIRFLIETYSLHSRGIGLTDAHLIASCLMTVGSALWTRDRSLERAARLTGISVFQP